MYKHFFKRVFDFCIALVALLLIGWLLVLIAVFLHFANKGAGAFFLQERPGKDEKIFKIIKFKTMTEERDENGNLLPDKDRLTKVGAVVRKLSIDELPQLINVFKGDMAFIGPRPLLPKYLPWYTERERLRHSIRPGITGWAQVNGRNKVDWDTKLAYDVEYVENLTLWFDIKIVISTIINVLKRKDIEVAPTGMFLDEERRNKQL